MRQFYSLETDTVEEVYNFIDNDLNQDRSSWKTNNDVPTPMGCVQEMLNEIPHNFWSKKDIRILDPCCGNGNFLVGSYSFLRQHHSKDEALQMLRGNDLNQERIENAKKILTSRVSLTTNDFLEWDTDETYDLIMANPPYAKIMENGSRASKNHNLTQQFILRSLEMLNHGGYLVYILPNHWMSLSDRNIVVRELSRYTFLHLNIHNAKRWFPKVGSTFTWFVVQKREPEPDTTFRVVGNYLKKYFDSQVEQSHRFYIPLYFTQEVYQIFQKTIENTTNKKLKVETSSDLHKYTKRNLIQDCQDETHIYKLIHTPKQTVYANRPHKFQKGWKVFISLTDKYKVFIDECGMTQSIAFIRCQNKNEAERIKLLLEHPLYQFINNVCRWGNFNNVRILQRFPECPHENNPYRYFQINQNEINIIQNFLS